MNAPNTDTVHHIDVYLFDRPGGGFDVGGPGEKDKRRVAQGDTIVWHFRTESRQDVDVEIAGFRAPKDYETDEDDRREAAPEPYHPVANPKLTTRVPRFQPRDPHSREAPQPVPEVSLQVRKGIPDVSPQKSLTYKYDIKVNGAVLRDPEIEIDR